MKPLYLKTRRGLKLKNSELQKCQKLAVDFILFGVCMKFTQVAQLWYLLVPKSFDEYNEDHVNEYG